MFSGVNYFFYYFFLFIFIFGFFASSFLALECCFLCVCLFCYVFFYVLFVCVSLCFSSCFFFFSLVILFPCFFFKVCFCYSLRLCFYVFFPCFFSVCPLLWCFFLMLFSSRVSLCLVSFSLVLCLFVGLKVTWLCLPVCVACFLQMIFLLGVILYVLLFFFLLLILLLVITLFLFVCLFVFHRACYISFKSQWRSLILNVFLCLFRGVYWS